MQGHTEAIYCRSHSRIYNGADFYCTPFIRVEKGQVRARDLRAIRPELLGEAVVVPQAIFRDIDEWRLITEAVAGLGHCRLDLNLGCPFPPQVKHGRGAALLHNPELLEAVGEEMRNYPQLSFSVKMRIGIEQPGEWRNVIDRINALPVSHVTVHPRVAAQQYGGPLHMDEFHALVSELSHPVVYNGDIMTPSDIDRMAALCPGLHGIMAGRGVMARPSLFAEWAQGREWTRDERLSALMRLHDMIFTHYRETLCGDAQILMKIKPFWLYLEPEIGRKPFKAIRKASSVAKYEAAVATIN